MPQSDHRSLWDLAAAAGLSPQRFLADHRGRVSLADLSQASTLDRPLDQFRDQSVLVWSNRQMIFALTALQLEGIAERIVLWPPDLPPVHLPAVLQQAQVDVIVCDAAAPDAPLISDTPVVRCSAAPQSRPPSQAPDRVVASARNGCCSPPAPPGGRSWWSIPWPA